MIQMKLVIDASNLIVGGGLLHLQQILSFPEAYNSRFSQIIVMASASTLAHLPSNDFLDLREMKFLNRPSFHRLFLQHWELEEIAYQEKGLLFIPGGLYIGNYRPYVTMFQNMQVFETCEKNREGISKEWLRLHLLQIGQAKTFRNSSGLIFISEYSQNYLQQFYPNLLKYTQICMIPHGIIQAEKVKKDYRFNKTIRILFVSTVKQYKHQWHLIEAVAQLRQQGFPLELHLIGSGDPGALKRMKESVQKHQKSGEFIKYHGGLTHSAALQWYGDVDLFAFPSSCETFGISLLEAMAGGLPIACSNRGPLPDILKDAGVYFNPEQPPSIAEALKFLLLDEKLRLTLGSKALSFSKTYNWKRSAEDTFSFLQSVNQRYLL